jgi:hypothetical protein
MRRRLLQNYRYTVAPPGERDCFTGNLRKSNKDDASIDAVSSERERSAAGRGRRCPE